MHQTRRGQDHALPFCAHLDVQVHLSTAIANLIQHQCDSPVERCRCRVFVAQGSSGGRLVALTGAPNPTLAPLRCDFHRQSVFALSWQATLPYHLASRQNDCIDGDVVNETLSDGRTRRLAQCRAQLCVPLKRRSSVLPDVERAIPTQTIYYTSADIPFTEAGKPFFVHFRVRTDLFVRSKVDF